MDENGKRIQREIAKDKIQIILASIALAVLIIMQFYVMINFKSNFIAMAVGTLLMIVALFFLISALMDMTLKTKEVEEQKYEEIYNAQKASYLVIKKSFDELEQRLRAMEESSALPAEDIINAQKAVAKVTISRSKENTDALMNSNDELINQLLSIQEKLDNNNNEMMEKQQSMLKESNIDLQQKIAEITSQLSNIEGRIQGGIPVAAAQPVQMEAPVDLGAAVAEAPVDIAPEISEAPAEEAPVEDLGMDLDAVVEEPALEEVAETDFATTDAADEVGLDIDALTAKAPAEESADDLGLDLDAIVEEPAAEEVLEEEPADGGTDEVGLDIEALTAEAPAEEATEDLGLDLDAIVEEPAVEEAPEEELAGGGAEEAGLDIEALTAEAPAEEVSEDLGIDIDSLVEEPAAEEAPAENSDIVDLGVDLDALLEEIGETPGVEELGEVVEEPVAEEAAAAEPAPEPEPAAEPEPEPTPEPAPAVEEKAEEIVIPDVGVDLSDPNRVMSAEEIEKLFANI